MKESERWDLRAKSKYHQWKAYEFEAKADEENREHYLGLVKSYKAMEKQAKEQADRCRKWEAWQK